MAIYFLDSYAILEIVKGNRSYEKFQRLDFFTLKINLFEVHFKLIREAGLVKANPVLVEYWKHVIDFDVEEIVEASKFRLEHIRRNLSMVDCLGYVTAKKIGAVFVTGDKEFKRMENVEFVK